MEELIITFTGIGMIVTGGIVGAISLIILEHYTYKLINHYRFWKFKRNLKERK